MSIEPCLKKLVCKNSYIPLASPGASAGKESACSEEDLGLIPGLGRSPGEGKGYPRQYSGMENSVNCIALASLTEKVMAAHSSTPAWKIHGQRSLTGCSPRGR